MRAAVSTRGSPDPMTGDRGFVYGATGPKFAALAVQSARTLRAACVDIPIDLWTDQRVPAGVFDRVHPTDAFFRPKFQALRDSRFARTYYLDADTIVLADISDAFELLRRFDIAAAHAENRNAPHAQRIWNEPVPPSFPQINGGVLGIRRSEATGAFLARIETVLREEGLSSDQPVMRELLWDGDLRLAILPVEYNFKLLPNAYTMSDTSPAPRLIHASRLHRRSSEDGTHLAWLSELHDDDLVEHFAQLIAADKALNPDTTAEVRALIKPPNRRKRGVLEKLGLKRQRTDWPFVPPS